MHSRPEVVVLGDVVVDVEVSAERWPRPGECVRPGALRIHSGGAAANTALALARLGRTVAFLGRVGADPLAEVPLAALRGAGVEVSHVQREGGAPTGLVYVAATPDGRRTTLAYQGASARYELDTQARAAVRGARLLHLTGYALPAEPQRAAALDAVATAAAAGVAVSLDPCLAAPEAALAAIRGLLPSLAVLLPNRAEALALADSADLDDAVARLRAATPALLGVKLDAAGCRLVHGAREAYAAAFPIALSSPAGAGDAFDAAVLCGVLDGLELETAAVLANACGALVAARPEAGEAAPLLTELAAFLHAHRDALGSAAASAVVSRWRRGAAATVGPPAGVPW
jgi:ribokinase